MSSLELYSEPEAMGTTKEISKVEVSVAGVAFPSFITLMTSGMAFLINMMVMNPDPVSTVISTALVGGTAGVGAYKLGVLADYRTQIFEELYPLYTKNVVYPKYRDIHRTRTEKRQVIVEDVKSLRRSDTKVTLTLVTNKKGIFFEKTIKEDPKDSWDKVLDSLIKVHGLESIDAIASATVPELTNDGQKLSWMNKLGTLLENAGVVEVCRKPNCKTECRHMF